MTTLAFTGLLDSIHHRVLRPDPDRRLWLEVPGPAGPRRLDPPTARDLAYLPGSGAGRDVLARAIGLAQRPQGPEGEWSVYLVWLLSPPLRRTVRSVCARLGADRRDVEAEAVAGLLSAVPDADPEHPEAARLLGRRASGRAWDAAKAALPELPVADAVAVAERWAARSGGPDGSQPWEWEGELTADLPGGEALRPRSEAPPGAVEGERLGVLAARMGLAEVARQARRSRGPVLGTLALRPAGGRR